jgi:hypothetical protein
MEKIEQTGSIGFASKWPATLIWGDSIDPVEAMEIIRRTDYALSYPIYVCNDHSFNEKLTQLLWGRSSDDDDQSQAVRSALWDAHNDWLESFEHINELNHLNNHWVASSYISGPHGWVHPDGTIMQFQNSGKWPDCDEFNSDLDLIVKHFPTLKFNIAFWDMEMSTLLEQNVRPEPTFGYRVNGDGTYDLVSVMLEDLPDGCFASIPSTDSFVLSIVSNSRKETTWTIQELKDMWGEKIEAAKKKFLISLDKKVKEYEKRFSS